MMNFFLRFTIVLFCLFSLASSNVNAQKKNRKMVKADQAFTLEQYNKAAELYKKAYQNTKSRALKSEIIFKQAECYRFSGNIKRAESYYKRAVKAKYPDVIVYLRYADVLRMNEKYEEANFGYTIGKTVPVGNYPSNQFGLHDVHGNVWEWVQDCWNDNYNGAAADGSVGTGDCSVRIQRGGSWGNKPRDLRSSKRDHYVFTTIQQ